jgi:hypothetical protein
MAEAVPHVIDTVDQLRAWRDAKLAPVVRDFKPAWLQEVSVAMSRLEIVFDLIFRPYAGRGWIRRRYRYDGEVNVLHFTGEVDFPESELSKLPDSALIE